MTMTTTAGSQNEDMSTMDHGSAHTTTGMTMDETGSMKGMIPLVAGADGTKASAAGLTLAPAHTTLTARRPTRWQLRITDKTGMAITDFERDQTKLMHLIVVRSDLTGYQHLHPMLGSGGVFSVELRLPKPGSYRAIADFTTSGKRYAIGASLDVPGMATESPLPAEAMSAEADGYSVMVVHKSVMAGSEAQLDFTIEKDGKPLSALLPYLGAYGHLVALRKPNLAYSHVHPTSENRAKGMIGFGAEFPRSGTYRLFLQFRTSSGVHTAPFTIRIG